MIVSDWLMPGMKGDEFLRVHEKYPEISKVMLTGQADDDAVERAQQDKAQLYYCLQKSWNAKELIETIQTGLTK
ncbi:two-component response regulator [Beggiatoa sp. PS]|nr:two-component response regulator [Beggiatoa sp. PS]